MVAGRREAGGSSDVDRQVIDGIDVLSMGGWYSPKMGMARRAMSFSQYTRKANKLRDLPATPDVVFATSTPLTVGIPGVRHSRRLGVPFVFEVRDLWPQAPIELGVLKDPVTKAAAKRMERWIYKNADHIIALSPGMAAGVIETGYPADQVTTIPNASDTDLFTPESRDRSLLEQWGLRDKFVAVHAGAMGRANGLDYVIAGARELAQMGRDDVHILIIGDGGTRPALEQQVLDWKLTNITFSGRLPRKDLGAVVSSCDTAITSFLNLPILATNSPNKLFDGLAAGIPNIVNAAGWTRDLVLDNDCGAYVEYDHPSQLAEALTTLADDQQLRERQGANARTLALEKFDRDKLFAQFERVLLDAVGAASTSSATRSMSVES